MAPSVPEFFSQKSVFITGGTGFIGKVLIYKLLKSCPEVKAIYLLVRTKKGVSGEERLKELFASRAFDNLREVQPNFHQKLKVISGDIVTDELGISQEDRIELQDNCNIIFHSAACVRFDQKLKDAVNMNIKGTLRLLTLAESMKNLKAFVHLSTAYCRNELEVLEEKLYKPVHKPRDIIQMVDWMDDQMLDYIEPNVIKSEPNTYSYTKAITEDLVAEYEEKFPVAIARPSIVISSWKEPVPGWIENMQGPTGLIIASGKGVIRSMHCEPSYYADAMAVDVIVNACILIAYTTALDKHRVTQVYNLTVSDMLKIKWGDVISVGRKLCNEYPFTVALWYPGGNIKSYWITHQICAVLFHTIPAYLLDGLLFLFRRKTFMVRLQKRISKGLSVLQEYTTKEWHFTNVHFRSLRHRVSKKDEEVFFTDLSTLSTEGLEEYFRDFVCGVREFVCKEDPRNLPRARRLHKVRYFVDRLTKLIFLSLVTWFLYTNFNVFTSSMGYLDQSLKRLLPS